MKSCSNFQVVLKVEKEDASMLHISSVKQADCQAPTLFVVATQPDALIITKELAANGIIMPNFQCPSGSNANIRQKHMPHDLEFAICGCTHPFAHG